MSCYDSHVLDAMTRLGESGEPMNAIKVQVQFEPDSKNLYAEIMIDDQLLVSLKRDELAIDLVELAKTIKQDGEFFIITCTCGNPGCAGITTGVNVHRDNETVHWQFKVRQADSKNVRAVSFAQKDYATAVQEGIAQFTELLKQHRDAEIVPYLMREQIESLKAK